MPVRTFSNSLNQQATGLEPSSVEASFWNIQQLCRATVTSLVEERGIPRQHPHPACTANAACDGLRPDIHVIPRPLNMGTVIDASDLAGPGYQTQHEVNARLPVAEMPCASRYHKWEAVFASSPIIENACHQKPYGRYGLESGNAAHLQVENRTHE